MLMEQMQSKDRLTEEAVQVFQQADSDGSGTLDFVEFVEHMHDDRLRAFFSQLELEIDSIHAAKGLFSLLDFDNDGDISINEFIKGCEKVKGYARSLDVARLMHVQQAQATRVREMDKNLSDLLEISRETQVRCDALVDKLMRRGGSGKSTMLGRSLMMGSSTYGQSVNYGVSSSNRLGSVDMGSVDWGAAATGSTGSSGSTGRPRQSTIGVDLFMATSSALEDRTTSSVGSAKRSVTFHTPNDRSRPAKPPGVPVPGFFAVDEELS